MTSNSQKQSKGITTTGVRNEAQLLHVPIATETQQALSSVLHELDEEEAVLCSDMQCLSILHAQQMHLNTEMRGGFEEYPRIRQDFIRIPNRSYICQCYSHFLINSYFQGSRCCNLVYM